MNINLAQRIAMSRRLVKIPQELSILIETITNTDEASSAYGDVDSSNRAFLSDSIAATDLLLAERLILQNIYYDTIIDGPPPGDVFADTATNPNTKFFPISPSPVWYYLIPQINIYSAGIKDVSQGINGWDMSDFCEEWKANAYKNLSNYIINGWGGGTGTVNKTTTSASDYDSSTNFITVNSTTGMSAGQIVILSGISPISPPITPAQHVYYVVEIIDGTDIVVKSMGGAIVDKAVATVIVSRPANVPWNNDFPLGTAALNDAETAITNWMNAYVGTTSTYYPAIATALTTWNGLANPNPKFRNAGLGPLYTASNNWTTAINNRIAVFGSVSQPTPPDGTFSNPLGAIGNRYVLLNAILNKSDGSAARMLASSETDTIMIQQIQNTVAMYDNYCSVMCSIPLVSDADGSNRIYLSAYQRTTTVYPSGYVRGATTIINAAPPRTIYPAYLNTGDTIYVYAEGQSEIATTLRGITSKGVADLADEIPEEYTTDNMARIYIPIGTTVFT